MWISSLLGDKLGECSPQAVRERGQSVSGLLAQAGRAEPRYCGSDFELLTCSGSGPLEGIDLDRSNDLLAAEDIET